MDKKKMKIPVFILTIIFLLFSTLLTVSVSSNEVFSSSITIYVGGIGPNNFSTIQEAIYSAADGYTIFVYSGIYVENIIIDRSISLVGEDRFTTIIDANFVDNGITVKSKYVSISQFTTPKLNQ